MILRGKGNYLIEGVNIPISDGDIFLYDTNESHCITDILDDEGMEILNIHFEPRCFWNNQEELYYLQTIFRRSQAHQNKISADLEVNRQIKELILHCKDEFDKKNIGYETVIKANLLMIFVLLFREEKPKEADSKSYFDEEQMKNINLTMDYICEHFKEPLTLNELSEMAKLSKAYYCTVFKSLNRITPWEYLTLKRIDHSMRLLRSKKDTVLDIALECGFNNTANFNKLFKKITGISPKEYRKGKK